tara:strand:- start:79 stop:444 length:366 start_codon:yes stop_codon:yes gene_type:complete
LTLAGQKAKICLAQQGTVLALFLTTGDIMKSKCKNPNGISNMQAIQDAKSNSPKFNSLQKATRYINELGYVFKVRNSVKEDRSVIYRHKFTKKGHVFLKSSYDFLSAGSMEMGTVWTIEQF